MNIHDDDAPESKNHIGLFEFMCFTMSVLLRRRPAFNPFVLPNLEPKCAPFFIRNQYSVIARKKSKTTAIISTVKI